MIKIFSKRFVCLKTKLLNSHVCRNIDVDGSSAYIFFHPLRNAKECLLFIIWKPKGHERSNKMSSILYIFGGFT